MSLLALVLCTTLQTATPEPQQLQISTRIYAQRAAQLQLSAFDSMQRVQGAANVTVFRSDKDELRGQFEKLEKQGALKLLSAPIIRTFDNMPASVTTQKGALTSSLKVTASPRGKFASISVEGSENGGTVSFKAHTLAALGSGTAFVVNNRDESFVYLLTVDRVRD